MKWFPFLFTALIICSCDSNDIKVVHQKAVIDTVKRVISYNDTVDFPFDEYSDSGYFKGYIAEKIDSLENKAGPLSYTFINSLLNKNELELADSFTLSHAVFIDQKTKVRYDTLKNQSALIVSEIGFGDKEYQKISINGKPVRNYEYRKDQEESVFYIQNSSFRYFLFKRKPFYYFEGSNGRSGSAALITIHFLYDVKNSVLSHFETFRVTAPLQFGDSNGDNKLDFIDIENEGWVGPTENFKNPFAIFLYSENGKGEFLQLHAKNGRTYSIEGNTGSDLYVQDTINIEKINWPVPIKY